MVLLLPGSVCGYVEFLAGSGAWMMSTEQIVFAKLSVYQDFKVENGGFGAWMMSTDQIFVAKYSAYLDFKVDNMTKT